MVVCAVRENVCMVYKNRGVACSCTEIAFAWRIILVRKCVMYGVDGCRGGGHVKKKERGGRRGMKTERGNGEGRENTTVRNNVRCCREEKGPCFGPKCEKRFGRIKTKKTQKRLKNKKTRA